MTQESPVRIPRKLRIQANDGTSRLVSESQLGTSPKATVVLGEPGMGKSGLMSELGKRLQVATVTAVRFMHSHDPRQFVASGKPLLIDALDEAMSKRDGDAMDRILAQLESAGSPDFIISCRSREWQSRHESGLRQIYGEAPKVFSLEPLVRSEAKEFLELQYPSVNSAHVLEHLDSNGLQDIYANPLTLGLMGTVASRDAKLPATRGALFGRVTALVWYEHDPDRSQSGLAQLTEEGGLDAAGAICAALLFSGAEAVSDAVPTARSLGDLPHSEISILPNASGTNAILGSKLFVSVGTQRLKPIHRVVSEFLAARWLTRCADTPKIQRRLLAQFHGAGAVPASLRGVHAWLAFHSPTMFEAIAQADPYGLLRYGESSTLTLTQADVLLESLRSLAESDPYFRAEEWDTQIAAGIMLPALREKIRAVVGSASSNSHLRWLLIEGLKGTSLARDLSSELEEILVSDQRFYSERLDAAEALHPLRDRAWAISVSSKLRDQASEDSIRLAKDVIEMSGCDVPDELLVDVVFAEIGLTICCLPKSDNRSSTIHDYRRLVDSLSVDRVVPVLDRMADYLCLLDDHDFDCSYDLAELVPRLILRAVRENLVSTSIAGSVWRWLRALTFVPRGEFTLGEKIREFFSEHADVRRAIQLHALLEARAGRRLFELVGELGNRQVGFSAAQNDAEWHLERFAELDRSNQEVRTDWQDLMRWARTPSGLSERTYELAKAFATGDAELTRFLDDLFHPKKPGWQVESEQRNEKYRVEQERKKIELCRSYERHREALRAGAPRVIADPARAYLGHFSQSAKLDLGPERIATWLNPDLAEDALQGFEAVLHRSDLPTLEQIGKSAAEGKTFYVSHAVIAALLERMRQGRSFDDLPKEVLLHSLRICVGTLVYVKDASLDDLSTALEQIVVSSESDREAFARIWIEPQLEARQEHVSGLYKLKSEGRWQHTGGKLAATWLRTYTELPLSVELDLVECLARNGRIEDLAELSNSKARAGYRDVAQGRFWQAVDLLVRFDEASHRLTSIGTRDRDFIWAVRERLGWSRGGALSTPRSDLVEWVISEFRVPWPYAELRGHGAGDCNPYDATDFLRSLIGRLANDPSSDASVALERLIAQPRDSYTDLIRHMAAEQRQKRAEMTFDPLAPAELRALLDSARPSNAEDLKATVLEELSVVQAKLLGEDIDQVRDFWGDDGNPRDENRCRDRLAGMLGPELARYDVYRLTEADMPKDKRVDLAFQAGELQMPMEVKGQWHNEVWDAATTQLDARYLIDWRSNQRGIYCVLWFGDRRSDSGRRLKAHPDGLEAPTSASQMKVMLAERISPAKRSLIDVVVLDLSAGAGF
ncbi:MAG: hypothetical protein Q8Q73_14360 [Stagnimonas sp.]|nr:hypothetical protein [Stagnimonas sp.]